MIVLEDVLMDKMISSVGVSNGVPALFVNGEKFEGAAFCRALFFFFPSNVFLLSGVEIYLPQTKKPSSERKAVRKA